MAKDTYVPASTLYRMCDMDGTAQIHVVDIDKNSVSLANITKQERAKVKLEIYTALSEEIGKYTHKQEQAEETMLHYAGESGKAQDALKALSTETNGQDEVLKAQERYRINMNNFSVFNNENANMEEFLKTLKDLRDGLGLEICEVD